MDVTSAKSFWLGRPVADGPLTARRSVRVVLLLAAIVLLNLVDLWFTCEARKHHGFQEWNLLMASVGTRPMVLLKLTLLAQATWILGALRRHRAAEIGCWILGATYAGVAAVWLGLYGFLLNSPCSG